MIDHDLAVEQLRHGNRLWRYVERELWLCRFYFAGVEDECHALLVCIGHPHLSLLRTDFLRDVFTTQPDLRPLASSATAYDFLLTLITRVTFLACQNGLRLRQMAFFGRGRGFGWDHPPPPDILACKPFCWLGKPFCRLGISQK
ncbi:hypothetical protein B0H12DRAFT_207505 [Mycena haematopus]|nr:hypothetical protein B0H12DRAFT_207505 [Mycena haematopus]